MIILLLILVNLLFYYRTIFYQGICDDIPVYNQEVTIPKGAWMFFWYHLHGRKYKNWKLAHAQTMTIHILNCILIYFAFGRNNISALAAVLFALNPVNNQCSIWISGKGYSMNLTCSLLMWLFPLASPLIYLYASYFNGPSIIFMPLLFIFTKHWYLAFLVFLGLYREKQRIFDKKNPQSKFNTETNKELLSVKPKKLVIMFKSLGYYVVNSVIALRLGYYHKYLFLHGVNAEENKKSYRIDKYFFIGIAFAALTLWTRNIGLLWYCIAIGMWTNGISMNQTITNRYIYIGSAGLMFALAGILIKFPILAAILLTYYAVKLIQFIIFYKNEYWSIEYSCMEQPDFFYPWQNRSVHCFQNGNYHGALGNMLKANELRPNDWKITYNLAQIYMMLGNLTACRQFYEQASKCNIDGREAAIGGLMKRLKDWIDSVENEAKNNNNSVNMDVRKFDLQR